jgi:hypothetical protein
MHNLAKNVDIEVTQVIYIDAEIMRQIECVQEITPKIELVKEFDPQISLDLPTFISTDAMVSGEIFIEQEFDLTTKELLYMQDMVGDPKEARMQKVVRYHFTMRASVKEISETLGIEQRTIYRDISDYKSQVLKDIKKDLRSNKKILGHMVELMTQLDHQTRTIWDRYNSLEADAGVYRRILKVADEQAQKGGEIKSINRVAEAMKIIFQVHDKQQQYLYLLKEQTKAMLMVWREFGLTGDDALKLVFSGGIDIDSKVEEVRGTIVKLIDIIKDEVEDVRARKNIFGRLANEVKLKALQQTGEVVDAAYKEN